MQRELIIFDFDGTLADSLSWLMTVLDDVADRYGFMRLDPAHMSHLRGCDIWQVLEHQRVARWKVPLVARHLRARMQRDIGRIRLFPGIEHALQRLAAGGGRLGIASSNSSRNVSAVLGASAGLFRHLECGVSLNGKATRLKRLLEASGVPPARAWYIGDELRDARAAAQVGVAFGAVAWGYTHVQTLAAAGAHATFASAEDLAEALLR
jgi:phosphoglycolate phosphatase